MRRVPLSRGFRAATGVLGALVLAQGVGKALHPAAYRSALAAFRLLSPQVIPLLAPLWTAAEIASGSAILAGCLARGRHASRWAPWIAPGCGLALVISVGYGVLNFTAYFRHVPVFNCTCFGAYLPQPLSPSVLRQDAGMLVWLGYAFWRARRAFSSAPDRPSV